MATEADETIRVVVVDDHAVVRRGLFAFFEGEPDIDVVGDAQDAHEALEQLAPSEFRRSVVDPDPEAILDPLRVRLGPFRRCLGEGGTDFAVALPDDQSVLNARAQVGDSDPVQAIEDTLRSFPAQEVVFVTSDGEGSRPIDEVRRRLDRPVRALRIAVRAPDREPST